MGLTVPAPALNRREAEMPTVETTIDETAVKQATLERLRSVVQQVVDAELLSCQEHMLVLADYVEGEGIAGQRVLTGAALSTLVDGEQKRTQRYLELAELLSPELYAASIMAFAIAGAMLWQVHQRKRLRWSCPEHTSPDQCHSPEDHYGPAPCRCVYAQAVGADVDPTEDRCLSETCSHHGIAHLRGECVELNYEQALADAERRFYRGMVGHD
jgi:hypothetical protein